MMHVLDDSVMFVTYCYYFYQFTFRQDYFCGKKIYIKQVFVLFHM